MSRQLQRLRPALRGVRSSAWRLASTTATNQRDERDDAAKPRSFASRLKDVGVGFAANASRSKEEKQVNLAKGITGGLPDFVEEWTPDLFRKVGKGLGVAAVASWPLAFHHDISLLVPLLASGATVGYWKIGLDDLKQTSSALPKNFPVLIHLRYILESIRPEIQQYFIEADESQGQVPFTRAMRSTIYQRAKGAQDTRALGMHELVRALARKAGQPRRELAVRRPARTDAGVDGEEEESDGDV